MLDSQPRLPRAPLVDVSVADEWEETTFTRPMRSPFAPDEGRAAKPVEIPRSKTPSSIEVSLEESALFERRMPTATSKPALVRRSTTPPPRRSAPPPPWEEETAKQIVPDPLLAAIRERDSAKIRAAVDLSKTVEAPTLAIHGVTEASSPIERR